MNNEKIISIPMTQNQLDECLNALDVVLWERCTTENEIDTVQDVYDHLAQFKNYDRGE